MRSTAVVEPLKKIADNAGISERIFDAITGHAPYKLAARAGLAGTVKAHTETPGAAALQSESNRLSQLSIKRRC